MALAFNSRTWESETGRFPWIWGISLDNTVSSWPAWVIVWNSEECHHQQKEPLIVTMKNNYMDSYQIKASARAHTHTFPLRQLANHVCDSCKISESTCRPELGWSEVDVAISSEVEMYNENIQWKPSKIIVTKATMAHIGVLFSECKNCLNILYTIAKILTPAFNRWGRWVPESLAKALQVIHLVCVGVGTEGEAVAILTDKGRPEDEIQVGWLQGPCIFYL